MSLTGLNIQGSEVLGSFWKICKGAYKVGKTVHDITKDKDKSEPKITHSQIGYGNNITFTQNNK